MKTAEEIKIIVEGLLNGTDLFLVDLQTSKNGNIDLYIDSLTGVDITRCAELNRKLNDSLDKENDDFSLTVSSAGIGYPFKVPGQFHKNIGKKVEVILKSDNKKLQGILKKFSGQEIVLEIEQLVLPEGKKKKEKIIIEKNLSLEEIRQIKDIITF